MKDKKKLTKDQIRKLKKLNADKMKSAENGKDILK